MKIPQYVTVEEVKRVCKELKISDWTKKKAPKVSPREARLILSVVNKEKMKINLKDFSQGLEVELEHGMTYQDANVTNNHPILTGKIVLAHLKESMDYYLRLEVAEIEGDILKALVAGNLEKVTVLHRKLARAKLALHQSETNQLA